MAGTLYLALECSGFETIVLTDGVNYSLDNQSGGWIPALGLDEEQRTVVDAIPINILPGAGATTVRRNLIRLTQMLRQISRGQQGDGGVVTLVYTSPNSSPAQRIAAQVIGWNPETFLPSVNAAENLPVDTINVVTLILEHRVPWVYMSYLSENLLTNSAWLVNPNWTVTGSAGTLTYFAASTPLPAGGQGFLQDVLGTFATRFLTAPTTQSFAVTAGQTYTIFFRAAATVPIPVFSIRLRNAANTLDISAAVSLESQVLTSTNIINGGQVVRGVVVATATDSQARIRLQYSASAAAATFQFAEFLVLAGDIAEDAWHRTSGEEGVSSISAVTALGVIQTTTLSPTPSLAPTMFTYLIGAAIGWSSGIFIAAKQGAITQSALPPALAFTAGYTSVADTAGNYALGGTILRYTPTVLTDVAQPVSSLSQPGASFVVIAARVNGVASYDVLIRATMGNGDVITTRRRTLSPRTAPYYVVLDRMALNSIDNGGVVTWELVVAASATGGSIDFDWWGLLADNHDTHIITHGVRTPLSIFVLDPRWLIDPIPSGFKSADNLLVTTDAPVLDTLWIATDATTKWQLDPATVVPQLQIRRPPAFDAPV